MSRQNKILITGATGFIGSHIVQHFCDKNQKVVCLVRRTSDVSFIKERGVAFRYGDIRDERSLIEAFEECDFIIHTAGFVRDWGHYKQFYETNVNGTLNVLKACVKNKIKNLIITGSISVYGEEDSKEVKDERSPYRSHYPYFLDKIFPSMFNYYRDTKRIATQEAIHCAKHFSLNCTILEPVWVYGEREFHTGFYEYLKCAHTLSHVPGSKGNKLHVIYAKDLARAYYVTFEKKLSGIHRIIIGNQNIDYMDTFYSLLCRAAHIKKPKNLPKAMVYPIGFMLELLWSIMGAKNPPLLTRGRINMFYDNCEYSTAKAKELLGFVNHYSLHEGIERTVTWYKENGYI
ncbi:MAG: NAD-dependent epimerase/dehydratase family protein [bacterium]